MKHLLKLLLVEIQNRFMCMKKHFFLHETLVYKAFGYDATETQSLLFAAQGFIVCPTDFFFLSLSLLARCSFSGLNLAMREHKT